ncbi:hypothetical protein RB195_008455 [Necator americanus]|uniref:Uncharacterized protein n=1 Tax=Necator americanus TaxID=51031 RepID=A0ABR1CNR2_NECAM
MMCFPIYCRESLQNIIDCSPKKTCWASQLSELLRSNRHEGTGGCDRGGGTVNLIASDDFTTLLQAQPPTASCFRG